MLQNTIRTERASRLRSKSRLLSSDSVLPVHPTVDPITTPQASSSSMNASHIKYGLSLMHDRSPSLTTALRIELSLINSDVGDKPAFPNSTHDNEESNSAPDIDSICGVRRLNFVKVQLTIFNHVLRADDVSEHWLCPDLDSPGLFGRRAKYVNRQPPL